MVMSETLSDETRRMLTDLAEMLVSALPHWRTVILEQAARGVDYKQWRLSFQPMVDAGILKGVFARSIARGEDPEELIRCFWNETRRVAGAMKVQ
jgi:hypothetical protein